MKKKTVFERAELLEKANQLTVLVDELRQPLTLGMYAQSSKFRDFELKELDESIQLMKDFIEEGKYI